MAILSFLIDILLPPASLAWLTLLMVLLPSRTRRGGMRRGPVLLVLVPLVLLAVPVVGQTLIWSLDVPAEEPGSPGAIVILSADTERVVGPERLQVGPMTLERERTGAALHRRTGLPVLVTGGLVNGAPPVGALMATSMDQDFGVPVQWAELRSSTTWENARFSVPMLKQAGITRVYLVTNGWHMRRSLLAFRRAGIEAVPAPVRQEPAPVLIATDLMPRMSGWSRSFYAIHEWVGLAFYTLRP